MKKITLVILAAGMGSRFGGLKQMEAVEPGGRVLLDFSVEDAVRSGFNKVVFIIKPEMYKTFSETIGKRVPGGVEVEYVFQTMEGIAGLPADRVKPLGTGQALLCCRNVINEPFAIINADDYYGKNAFGGLHKHLLNCAPNEFAMVCYDLKNTLSQNGTVARGICEVEDGMLKSIVERKKIKDMSFTEDDGATWTKLPEDTVVSMNIWGFTPMIFDELEAGFKKFLDTGDLSKGEYLLPEAVGDMIAEGKATVKVLPNHDKWYGMTYREDMPEVKRAIQEMIDSGDYERAE